uniref:C2H2-type domain-containing protein n=1 Tax=Sipha flava TaxID=143950 RepID=A0A2S2QH85_9HEMI
MVFVDFCVDDPSKTFWDDPNMYVDDPGLDILLSLTTDEFLLCSNQDASVAEVNDDPELTDGSPQNEQQQQQQQQQQNKSNNDGKQALICMYPNCDKSYLKPSHLKVN